MSSEEEQRNEVAVAGPSQELPPPKIFKLTIDCFNEIFEYLSLKDLYSVGETCKTMQQVAGEYFKQNCSAVETFCRNNGVYTPYSSKKGMFDEYIHASAFIEFMPCISIDDGRLTPLQYFQSHIDEFKSINHIDLLAIRINKENVEFFRKLLPKIEIVRIRVCAMNGNFYELLLKNCPNLKRIYLQNANFSFSCYHEWLLQDYPKLEHLELLPDRPTRIDRLNTFFQRNPKVQRFSTTSTFLVDNQNEFLKSNTKIDLLEVKKSVSFEGFFFAFRGYDETATITSIWDLLNKLHKQGFYKRLFFYIECVDEDLSNKLNSVPGLELLCIRRFDESFNLPLLINLKELIILTGLTAINAQILSKGLIELERLYVDKTTIEDILPFIRQSTKLNKIKMLHKDIKNKDSTDWRVLNLAAINNEREQLSRARKLTIYVRDDVFVATKWAAKNGDIDLSHIEMKRSDSLEWNHFY